MSLRIVETDEVGNLLASYVQSDVPSDGDAARIDVILPEKPKSFLKRFVDVFLPTGFPHSVTDDYLEYQIYDSLQAFSSSIAGLLASRAVLEGVGVGDASASPTAALLLTILQESTGRIATILFAHRLGTALEPECKMFRLLADIFNDIAMILDCLSPVFPKAARVLVLSGSSVLRALCGVAAGSAKASLSAHFARNNNLAELNAKDSSQETVISLLGMAAGSVIVSWVTTPLATWTILMLLLSVHIAMNHAAVRAVTMLSLNRQRATIVFAHLLERGVVLTPDQVSLKERIFEHDGVIRDAGDTILGICEIGVSPMKVLATLSGTQGFNQSMRIPKDETRKLFSEYTEETYVLHVSTQPYRKISIMLKTNSDSSTQLKAWYHSVLITHLLTRHEPENARWQMSDSVWLSVEAQLRSAGWDLGIAALETRPGCRVSISNENDHEGDHAKTR